MAGNLGKEDSSSVQGVQDPSIIGGSKMAGNLGKEDPSSVQDVQDPSVTGSGHKRPRAGNTSSAERSKDQREKKKKEMEKLKVEMKELENGNSHLEGQVFELRKFLEKTTNENVNLKIVQMSQSDSILKLGKELIASGEKINALKEELVERDRKFNALKEELERQKQLCSLWHIDMGILGTPDMNNPVETPASTAQATSNFVNSDVHFASQMA